MINNYSNIQLPRTIDNQYSLILNRFRFQPDSEDHTGQILSALDINGEIAFVDDIGQTSQTIQVHCDFQNEGNKRSSVGNAIDYAITLSPSASNIILIKVLACTTSETKQLAPPDFVYIRGESIESTIVLLTTPLAAGEPFFKCTSGNTSLYSLTMNCANNSTYCFAFDETLFFSSMFAERLTFIGGTTATVYCKNQNVLIFLRGNCFTLGGYGIYCTDGGYFVCANVLTLNLLFNGAGTGYRFEDMTKEAALLVDPTVVDSSCVGYDLGIYQDNSFCQYIGSDYAGNTTTGIQLINNSAALFIGGNLIGTVTTEIDCDSTSQVYSTNVQLSVENLSITSNDISLNYNEFTADQVLGTHQIGSFVTGDKTIAESVSYFGQGAFNFKGIKYFKYDTSGVIYTDVTDDLRPSIATGITVWDAVNDIFYIGDDEKFYSWEACISTAFVGEYTAEYWNGSTWTPFVGLMTTSSAIPYSSCEDMIFALVEVQDTRLTVQLGGTNYNWSKTTINGEDKYWIRLTATTLTTGPVLECLRLLYSSTKIDSNGVLLRYGNSRTFQPIVYDLNLIRSPGNASTRPSNQDIYMGEDSRLGREQNSLSTGDIIGLTFFVPNNADSSSPFRASICFVSSSSAASQADFNLQITIGNLHIGDPVYFTQAAANGNQIRDQFQTTLSLTPNPTNGTYAVIQDIDVPIPFVRSRNIDAVIDEIFSADIESLPSDNPNDLVFIQISLQFVSWNSGLNFVSL